MAEKVNLTGARNGAGTAADAKALSIVRGMIAGADSIEDLDVLWHLQCVDVPGTRTDYVSTQQGTSWVESVATGPGLVLMSQGPKSAYKPGSRQVRDWFGPVTRPANGNTY
ncbi:hypothetical protein ACF08M_39030 [Streptomyces sp. NPDC015032]|uniref:hypothetical protein n=1 Tax=Streptomyces sp. NPDC015032 TaxID=3364937 RepID=UPI0036FDBE3B